MKDIATINMSIYLLLTVITSPLVSSIARYNYCTIQTCAPESHTLCNYGLDDVAYERCYNIISNELTLEERNSIVNLHNHLRRRVYNGNELRGRPGPQPAAANATLMEWDVELSIAAQVWVQQCPDVADECRNVVRFMVNQNVGKRQSRGHIDQLTTEEIIWGWYDEVERFSALEVPMYSRDSAQLMRTSHYTNIIWEQSTRIGCAQIKYFDGVFYQLRLVCNYGPAGNINGQPVYAIRGNPSQLFLDVMANLRL